MYPLPPDWDPFAPPEPWLHRHYRKLLIGLLVVGVALVGGYFATRETLEEHLAGAQAARASGEYQVAIAEFGNAARMAPGDAGIRNQLGEACYRAGDYPGAVEAWSKARELGLRQPEVEIHLARAYLALNRPEQVLARVSTHAATAEDSACLLALHARANFMDGDLGTAYALLATADQSSPDHPDALLARALIARSHGDLAGALGLVERALVKAGKRGDLWTLKGDLALASRQMDIAQRAYAQALALNPRDTPARLATIQIEIDNGALDRARAALRQLNRYSPDDPKGLYFDAFLDFRDANYQQAENKLGRVLRAHPIPRLPDCSLAPPTWR